MRGFWLSLGVVLGLVACTASATHDSPAVLPDNASCTVDSKCESGCCGFDDGAAAAKCVTRAGGSKTGCLCEEGTVCSDGSECSSGAAGGVAVCQPAASEDDGGAKSDSSSSCVTPCGSACCGTDGLCVRDGAGKLSCAPTCTDSSECAAGCCAAIDDTGTCSHNGTHWACLPPSSACLGTIACRCTTSAQCGIGHSCAPHADAATSKPIGPYICKANDGVIYDGCIPSGAGACDDGCCVTDANGNRFCASVCTDDSTCGPVGHCDTFATSCGGGRACAL